MKTQIFACREDLSALFVPLDAVEKRAGADVDAAASSATLWDDICHLAAGMPDIPPMLRDRMPPGVLLLSLPFLVLAHWPASRTSCPRCTTACLLVRSVGSAFPSQDGSSFSLSYVYATGAGLSSFSW